MLCDGGPEVAGSDTLSICYDNLVASAHLEADDLYAQYLEQQYQRIRGELTDYIKKRDHRRRA